MLFKGFFVLLLMILGAANIFACMCGGISVCDAYTQANAVVIAEVVSFKTKQVSLDRIFVGGRADQFESGQEVHLRVSKWFKGNGQEIIKLTQPNSTCDWTFDEGGLNKKYLFYLGYSKRHKDYAVMTCGRSAELAIAQDDISWLNQLPKSLNRTRMSGVVQLSDDNFSRISKTKITIAGAGRRFDIVTDENGLYEIWDLRPGKYRVTAMNPPSNVVKLDAICSQ